METLEEVMANPSGLVNCDLEYCGEGSTNAVFKTMDYPIVLRIPKVQDVNNKDDNEAFVDAVCKTPLGKYIYRLRPCFLDPRIKVVFDEILQRNRRSTFKDRPLIEPTEYDSHGNFYGTWCLSPHALKDEIGGKELIFELKPKEGTLYNSTHYTATDKCDELLNSLDKFKEVLGEKYPNEHECMFNRRQGDAACSKYSKKVPLCTISFYNAILDRDLASLQSQLLRLFDNGESYFIVSKNTILPSATHAQKEQLCHIMSQIITREDVFELLYAYQSVDILGIKRSVLLYQILTEQEDPILLHLRNVCIEEYIEYCASNCLGYQDKFEDVVKNYDKWLDEIFLQRVQDLIPKVNTELSRIRRSGCNCEFTTSPYTENKDEIATPAFVPFVDPKMNENIPVIVLMQLFLLSKTFVDSSIIFTLKQNTQKDLDCKNPTTGIKYTDMIFDGIQYLLNVQVVDVDAKKFTHIKNWKKYVKLE